jgi:hypothetical protein
VKIKDIDGIPCIVLTDEKEEQKKWDNISPENQSTLRDYTQLQRSKELDNRKELMDDLKKKFKTNKKSLL